MTIDEDAILLLFAVLAVLAVVGVWLSWTAGRLDRMNLRCERARAALEETLARRRALAVELAAGHLLDPASAVLLADAAARTTIGDDADRWQHESDLSAVLRAVAAVEPGAGGGGEVWDELESTAHRLGLARRIHNDLVATTLALRGRRRVRWFRLTGHAPAPAMIAFDDEPPARPDAS